MSRADVGMMLTVEDKTAIVVKCCACRRIRKKGRWMLPQGRAEHVPVYSHTYCPSCFRNAYALLDAQDAYKVCAG